FSLSNGTFTFVAGKLAKTGGLRIDTPVGRIRGTAQNGGIGTLTLAGLTFAVMDQIQAASRSPGFLDDDSLDFAGHRSHGFLDDDTLTYKHLPHGVFEIVTRDGRVILQDDPGETIQIDPSGEVTRIPNSSSRMAELQNLQQAALSTLSQGPSGAAPGGSSTDTSNAPWGLQPINFARGTDGPPARLPPSLSHRIAQGSLTSLSSRSPSCRPIRDCTRSSRSPTPPAIPGSTLLLSRPLASP